MKRRLIYLLPLALAFATGCFKDRTSTPIPSPSGTFVGQFRVVHKRSTTHFDTVKSTIQLDIQPSTGFKVTGDTATLHAGSNGGYIYDQYYIRFDDKTYPATGVPAKNHLNGTYQYYYDGTIFQFARSVADTVSYQYDLKRKN